MYVMATLKAEVKNGRLVLDEPTDLPEGTVIQLDVARTADDRHAHLDETDDPFVALSAGERRALEDSLDCGTAQMEAGQGRPLREFLDDL